MGLPRVLPLPSFRLIQLSVIIILWKSLSFRLILPRPIWLLGASVLLPIVTIWIPVVATCALGTAAVAAELLVWRGGVVVTVTRLGETGGTTAGLVLIAVCGSHHRGWRLAFAAAAAASWPSHHEWTLRMLRFLVFARWDRFEWLLLLCRRWVSLRKL